MNADSQSTAGHPCRSPRWTSWRQLLAGGIIFFHSFFCLTVFAQGTAFTYQGRLADGPSPANGAYDLTFTLFPFSSGGAPVAGTVTNNATGVTNGLFTVTLDFGTNIFTGADRWLEIDVRTNGAGSFSTLTPRQEITATPYAIYAPKAGVAAAAGSVAATNLTGSVAASQLPSDVALVDASQIFTRQNIFVTNVGVGNASPAQLLQVGSSATPGSQGMIRLSSRSTSGAASRDWDIGVPQTGPATDGIGYSFVINDVAANTTDFMIKWATGNVGIGTTNPGVTLDVNGTARATSFIGDGSGLANVALLNASSQIFTGTNRFDGTLLVGSNNLVASSENSAARIVSGIVNADGSIASGTNFVVQPLGNGQYLVNFFQTIPSQVFASPPAVTVTVQTNTPVASGQTFTFYSAQIISQTSTYFLVQISTINVQAVVIPGGPVVSQLQNTPVNCGFNFIAIGPRGSGTFR